MKSNKLFLFPFLLLLLLAACSDKDQKDGISSTDEDTEEIVVSSEGQVKSKKELSKLEKEVETFVNEFYEAYEKQRDSRVYDEESARKYYEMHYDYFSSNTDVERVVEGDIKYHERDWYMKHHDEDTYSFSVEVLEMTNESAVTIRGLDFMEFLVNVTRVHRYYDENLELVEDKTIVEEFPAHILVTKTDKAKYGYLFESMKSLDDN